MSYKVFKKTQEIEAVDSLTMEDMSIEDYKLYVKSKLISIDHHNILKSGIAGYPIARTKEQLDIFINHLNEIRSSLK